MCWVKLVGIGRKTVARGFAPLGLMLYSDLFSYPRGLHVLG
jgi:hypothetical protein